MPSKFLKLICSCAFAICIAVYSQASDRENQTWAYTKTFEGKVGPEWSSAKTSTTPSGRKFLGQFSKNGVTLSLNDLPPHSQVTISFELFIMSSWDGNSKEWGPDIWELSVKDGPTLLHTTFSNSGIQAFPQNYPGGKNIARSGASENNTLGYVFRYGGKRHPADSVYRLKYTFSHTEDSVMFQFSGIDLQGVHDESWGLANVAVHLDGKIDNKVQKRFEIVGPKAVKWEDEVVYETFEIKDGKQKPLHLNVKYQIQGAKSKDFKITPINYNKIRLQFPKAYAQFCEQNITLIAQVDFPVMGDDKSTANNASLDIVISNISDQCHLLQSEIKKIEAQIATLHREVRLCKEQLTTIKIPPRFSDEDAQKLQQQKESLKQQKEKLQTAVEKTAKAIQELRKQQQEANRLNMVLTRCMTQAERAFIALGNYKNSAKTRENKLEFLQTFLPRFHRGKTDSWSDGEVDNEFSIAYMKARKLAIARVGFGLVGIANLATMIIPHPGGRYSIVFEAFMFALGTEVDKKIDPLMNEVRNYNTLLKSEYYPMLKELQQLAEQVQKLKKKGPQAQLKKFENLLRQKVQKLQKMNLHVLSEAIKLVNIAKKRQKKMQKQLKTIEREWKNKKEQYEQFLVAQDKRNWEILDKKQSIFELKSKIQTSEEKLIRLNQRLQEFSTVYNKYCTEKK
ncbi:hypothetical protein [Candidatus Uabimicrobium amorphum]|uniref:Chromosome partition protein Smc n=1 Tax=Uabimicrobium amorphum TaxID=2596890 RepID=A0A5S9F6B9_UABAM|nr:hypothetical protein [Candidatus Uabimicrobium amorphum]BBM86499.1 chromosome partition protein Smc [Candidatus Uabimicrobium amorphum]